MFESHRTPRSLGSSKELVDLAVVATDHLEHGMDFVKPLVLDKVPGDSVGRACLSMARLRMLPPVDLGDLEVGLLGTLHINPQLAAVAVALDQLLALLGLRMRLRPNPELGRRRKRQPRQRRHAVKVLQVVVVS